MKFFKLFEKQNFYADLILLFLSILICYYGVSTSGYVSFGINILNDLKNNWSLKPITDINISNNICPSDYEPLTSYKWPGTVKGCYCPSFILSSSLSTGSCSRKSNCNNVLAYKPYNLDIWEGNMICVKREGLNYLEYLKTLNFQSSDMCDLSKKNCGKLDNLGKNFCISQNEKCMINDIKFDSSNSQFVGYNKIQLNTEKSIFYSNEESIKNVMVEFKISEGFPCIDPNQTTMKENIYKLINDQLISPYGCINNINNINTDNRFVKIDEVSLLGLIQSNHFNLVLETLPDYILPDQNIKIDLYSRGYLGWSLSCSRDTILNPDNVISSISKIEDINWGQNLTYWSSIVYLILMIILFLIKSSESSSENTATDKIFWCDFINFIFISLCSVYVLLTYIRSSGLSEFYSGLKKYNCGDSITNSVLLMMAEGLELNMKKNIMSTYLYVFTAIIIPLNILIMYLRTPKEYFDKTKVIEKDDLKENLIKKENDDEVNQHDKI